MNTWLSWIDINDVGFMTLDELREGMAVVIDPGRTSLPARTDRDRARRVARLKTFQEPTLVATVLLLNTGEPAAVPVSHDEYPQVFDLRMRVCVHKYVRA